MLSHSKSTDQSHQQPISKTNSRRCNAVALFDFDGDPTAGDLTFLSGETIEDIDIVSDEWLSGRIGARTGMFPKSFVHIVS
jgi:hypothetical protein